MTAAPHVSPEQLLRQAAALCDGLDDVGASYWARAAAFLARMALEEAVTAVVMTLDPALDDASMASKLLLLHMRADEETVRAAQRAWAGLSRTCHHHAYELAPTRGEIADLIDAVQQVLQTALCTPKAGSIHDPAPPLLTTRAPVSEQHLGIGSSVGSRNSPAKRPI